MYPPWGWCLKVERTPKGFQNIACGFTTSKELLKSSVLSHSWALMTLSAECSWMQQQIAHIFFHFFSLSCFLLFSIFFVSFSFLSFRHLSPLCLSSVTLGYLASFHPQLQEPPTLYNELWWIWKGIKYSYLWVIMMYMILLLNITWLFLCPFTFWN